MCIISKKKLIKDKSFYKRNIKPIIIENPKESIDIDTINDLEYARFLNLNEEYLRISLIVAICFAEEHNSSIIKNLNLPQVYNKLQFLKLGNDAISQLDLIKKLLILH